MIQKMSAGFAKSGLLFALIVVGLAPAWAQTFPGVLTQHNDNGRTGQNLTETKLTTQNVNSRTFGKVFSYSVDGQIYGQPLYVPNVNIPGQGTHNVVYVTTQMDSLYAFDADGLTSTPLFQVSFINPAAGITPVWCTSNLNPDKYCSVFPVVGINSTPVIDPSTNTMYLVTRTINKGQYIQGLHAVDITTGAEKFGGPVSVSASVPGTGGGSKNGFINFAAPSSIQRAGLLLANGRIYIGWAGVQHGWLMAYDAHTLQQVAVFQPTPNSLGGGVWASGNGLVADANGDVYAAVSDGGFDANTGGPDWGDTLVKFDAGLNIIDYFTPMDQNCRALNDLDLGSGGPMLLPTQTGGVPNELVAAGKGGAPCDSNLNASPIYVVNQDAMGGYNATQDQDVQEVAGAVGGYWSSPAYWQGANGAYVYYGGVVAEAGLGEPLKMYSVTNGILSTAPVAQSSNIYPVGTIPSVSANGTTNGIVWTVVRPDALGTAPGIQPAVLYAYDATNVASMLYNSASVVTQGGIRDRGGCANKFAVPTIANGRVYVGTQNELDVFGLFTTKKAANVYLGNPCWKFPTTTVGTPVSQPFSVVNSGNLPLTISNVTITGTNSADYSQTNTCSTTLAPAAKCVVTVTFTPSVKGPEVGYVMLTDNAGGSPHNIFLTGAGK